MRVAIILPLLVLPLSAQPNCTGVAAEVNSACACVLHPDSDLCKMNKAMSKKGTMLNPKAAPNLNPQVRERPAVPVSSLYASRPAAAPAARTMALPHKDYLRFIQPDARFALGLDLEKLMSLSSPELAAALLGDGHMNAKIAAAVKEIDHFWLAASGQKDVLVLMTGRFEGGATTQMFLSQGVSPVMLGSGMRAMLVGPEPSVQAALARLLRPASTDGWVSGRSRIMAKDHEIWVVSEPAEGSLASGSALATVRRFGLGLRVAGEASGFDVEVAAASETGANQIASWFEQTKASLPDKFKLVLDSIAMERSGSVVRFTTRGDALFTPDNSPATADIGVELYGLIASGFPGLPARAVSREKLRAVQVGMKREEVLALLGKPLSVNSIQGLEVPRETWVYQTPFSKQQTIRLDDGVVSMTPTLR